MGSEFRDSARFRWKIIWRRKTSGVVAQLVENLLSMHETLGLISSPAYTSCTCNPSTWDQQFNVFLGYIRTFKLACATWDPASKKKKVLVLHVLYLCFLDSIV